MRPHKKLRVWKKLIYFLFFTLYSLPFTICAAQAGQKLTGASLMVSRNVYDSAGGRAGSGSINLNSALGEAAISSFSGTGFRLYPGYIKLASQPGSVVSIAAVTKSTGALRVSWNSPGSNGFEGDIINGYYRVDYSSDPAHVFNPSVYKMEFSTSTDASRPQFLDIGGLEPNTTYYAKIYISDSQKFFSEDSTRSDESTLANFPVNPIFSGVAACSATITWALPLGGSEGYAMEASSTDFGALYPGGEIKTVSTPDGLRLDLTLNGLAPATTYFFKVASLNWHGDKNIVTVISTVTRPGVCDAQCLANLAASGNAWNRMVNLTWDNPSNPAPQGVLIVLSTNSSAPGIADYSNYIPGQTLADNSLVKSTSTLYGFGDSGLTMDTTYFYHLFAQYEGLIYSVSVSTYVFLDLPPMAPAGLTSSLSVDRSSITISWKSVATNRDGSMFFSTAVPQNFELTQYRIDRATSVLNANWVTIATVPITEQAFTDTIPDPNQVFLYRISANDSIGTADACMAVDTNRNLYAFASDKVTRLKISPELSAELLSGSGPEQADVVICAVDEAPAPADKIFASVRFNALKIPGNQTLNRFQFSRPEIDVVLKYEVVGGKVAPAGMSLPPSRDMPYSHSNIYASAAPSSLAMYWNNTEKYVKLFGRVDAQNQTVSIQSAMTGSYQIRSLLRESGVSFDVSGLSNKIITPNGDGLNDTAVFTFDNPKDSAFSGKIFDIEGAFVADMLQGPISNSLQWDGKRDGAKVQGGVYVYQIRAEDKAFNGTLMVIR
ncbi:MAG: gliding motility-associated C-terminal domain-containing protein [Elusimicrobia bacterium]|nr:gliding motility-associated C-terminal domain-containing protein [Elusimicrobiota bacterium]